MAKIDTRTMADRVYQPTPHEIKKRGVSRTKQIDSLHRNISKSYVSAVTLARLETDSRWLQIANKIHEARKMLLEISPVHKDSL